MAEPAPETQVRVLTRDMEAVKRKLRRMDEEAAAENALLVAARRDSLRALELIPKIDDGVRTLRVELKSEIAEVRNDLREFRTEVNQRFDSVNQRFDSVNQRFDSLEVRVTAQDEVLGRIAAHLGV
jgi:uncharacterized coiled-coil protein SlyX